MNSSIEQLIELTSSTYSIFFILPFHVITVHLSDYYFDHIGGVHKWVVKSPSGTVMIEINDAITDMLKSRF